MKKAITLRRPLADRIKSLVMKQAEPFAKFLSELVEEEISPFQVLLVLQAVLSFTALVFSVCVPLFLRLLMLAWFLFALLQCRRVGLR